MTTRTRPRPGTSTPPSRRTAAASSTAAITAGAQLKSVTTAGKGLVGVILPDVTTSARYTSYDLPYLTKAFTEAGYATTDFKIDNAQGTTTTQLAIAQADITAGAKVLLVDPLDGPTGKQVQAAAAAGPDVPATASPRAPTQLRRPPPPARTRFAVSARPRCCAASGGPARRGGCWRREFSWSTGESMLFSPYLSCPPIPLYAGQHRMTSCGIILEST